MFKKDSTYNERLQKLYELKVQQIEKISSSESSIRILVMRAEADAINQSIRSLSET